MKFKYDRLHRPDREIRVAVLQPGTFDDLLVVHFIRRDLAKGAPAYEALSYVWGSADDHSHVEVTSQLNTGDIPITKNLDLALRHLRYTETPRYLWVDALCINQAKNAEKSKQVAAMGTIFKTADRVTAWLGPEENNSDLAMAWFRAIRRNLDIGWKTGAMHLRRDEVANGFDTRQEQEMPGLVDFVQGHATFPWTPEEASSVFSIFDRPYFGRAWVAQEIRLARHVFFQCGQSTIPEKHLWVSSRVLNRNFKLKAGFTSFERWFEVRQRVFLLADLRMQGAGETLFTLRQNLSHLRCDDPRDKIYSTLGLMALSNQNLTIVPSYAQSTEQVYTDIARRAITQWSDLEILNNCELPFRVLDIPSWVPDWSIPARSKDMGLTWSACAHVTGRPSFDASGLQCTVSGVLRNRIIEVVDRGDINFEMSDKELWKTIRSWRPAVASLDDIHPTGERLLEVYCRMFVWNSFPEGCLTFAMSLEALEKAWRGDESSSEHDFSRNLADQNSYFGRLPTTMRNRRIFKTSSYHLGIGPDDARADDVVCILLGSRHPVILRPAANRTYQVVGTCYLHGFMNGEIIYNNDHTRASSIQLRPIDPETGRNTGSPESLLGKACLRVDSKRSEFPWTCTVSDESLLAAGIQVEDFVLV